MDTTIVKKFKKNTPEREEAIRIVKLCYKYKNYIGTDVNWETGICRYWYSDSLNRERSRVISLDEATIISKITSIDSDTLIDFFDIKKKELGRWCK